MGNEKKIKNTKDCIRRNVLLFLLCKIHPKASKKHSVTESRIKAGAKNNFFLCKGTKAFYICETL